jgi:H+/Cl- antiporter ClcA
MKRIFSTLLKAAGIGLVCGVLFGFFGGLLMYSNAVEKARDMHPGEAGTYLCAAGNAPIALAILGVPAGAFVGLSTAGLIIWFRKSTGRDKLP